jgi:hypothetical protein
MFKAIRISVLLFILVFVLLEAWHTRARTTDWDSSLWLKIYPINADGSTATANYIDRLEVANFGAIETFFATEADRYGKPIQRPVRVELGRPIYEQPPAIPDRPGRLDIMLWSLKMRWWVGSVTNDQDRIEPDISIFVRYHQPEGNPRLEDSVGVPKGMFGIVNGYTGRAYSGTNNVIIAHELLHTLGASDKYVPETGMPAPPDGFAEPERIPLYPQRYAEIMGGRIPRSQTEADIPGSLGLARIGPTTAREIRLLDQ